MTRLTSIATPHSSLLSASWSEVAVTGGRVRYRRVGSGRPVLFVHGVFVNSDLWREVVEELAHHDCIVLDLPFGSHELAMDPDADLSPPALARLLGEVIEALELSPVRIVANDSGGALTQLLIAARPELVDSVVLTSCDAYDHYFPPLFRTLPIVARIPGAIRVLGTCLQWGWFRRLPLAYGWATRRPMPRSVQKSYVDPLRHSAAVRRDLAKALRDVRPELTRGAVEGLRRFSGKVLLVWGTYDKVFPLRLGQQLERDLPDARLVTVEAGAFVPEDAPAPLARLIDDFWPRSEVGADGASEGGP